MGLWKSCVRVGGILLTLMAAGGGAVLAQPAEPVIDLNTTREDFTEPLLLGQDFVTSGNTVFFIHDDGIHGMEIWKSDGTAAGTVLVKDVCPGFCRSFPGSLTVWDGVLYWAADDGVHGRELWKSDGTAAGTSLVTDLRPGLQGGVSQLMLAGDVLYLAANDGILGDEVWKTDGTAAGTQLVADLQPGGASSYPYFWLDAGGKLLFFANDGVHGSEPWLTEGTLASTMLLKDIRPGALGSNFGVQPESAYNLGGGFFLFVADDGSHGYEPWISDGTTGGTALLADINPGANGSTPRGFTALGNRVLFTAYDDTLSWELWSTNGSGPGTTLVKDISNLFGGSFPQGFTVLGSHAYFMGSDIATGRELWRTDGTAAGTALVKDINPGAASGFSIHYRFVLRAAGGSLLFFADDGVHGAELWKSDGTEAGTVLVKDIEPGPAIGFALGYSGLTAVGGTVYFHGLTTAHGVELWKSDGTEAGTVEVKNAAFVRSSLSPWFLTNGMGQVAGRLLFDAEDGVSGFEPWTTDGTVAGTWQLGDLVPGPNWSSPVTAVSVGGKALLSAGNSEGVWLSDGTPADTTRLSSPVQLFQAAPALGGILFSGYDYAEGIELWRSDGTEAGTFQIADINAADGNSSPEEFTDLGSVAVFTALDGIDKGLWRTEGNIGDALKLSALASNVDSLTGVGSSAFFTAIFPGSGTELGITDGSADILDPLKDIQPGEGSSRPHDLTRVGNLLFFFADDGTSGDELWKSDGTEVGTVLVKDVSPGPSPSLGKALAAVDGILFFTALNPTTGIELWRSDGTAAGTFLLKDILPGFRSSEIEDWAVAGERLFFVADDGAHGRELWVSDGTVGGTRLVEDIFPGPGSPAIQNLTTVRYLVVFSADDGVHGREMWRSNGSGAGTFQVQDIAAGPASSSPIGFTLLGERLYFAANDNAAGFELWEVPTSELYATFPDAPVGGFAWPFIEALSMADLTGGCAGGGFCPSQAVTRAEMAVFLERGLQGSGFVPPPATGFFFQDVPANHWAGAWIEQLAVDGISGGCSVTPPLFCPTTPVSRAQMAIFLLLAKHGPGYTPPPATGTRFADVPSNHWAAPWIEQLAAEGITSGCEPDRYCPDAPVARNQMAIFLAVVFDLPLP